MKEFAKQNDKAEMNQEMMDDAFAMGEGNVEEQADDVYENILGEIGLEYDMNAGKAGAGNVKVAGQQ